MWGMLEKISEIPPEYIRTALYQGDFIRLHQWDNKCIGEMAETNEPYCRLSIELDERAPHGWFWLKDWSENEHLVKWLVEEKILEVHPTESRATGYVVTKAARLIRPQFGGWVEP